MTEDELEPDIGRKDWIAIGLVIGVGGGLLLDNLAVGIPLGVVFGVLMNKRKAKEDAQQKENDKNEE